MGQTDKRAVPVFALGGFCNLIMVLPVPRNRKERRKSEKESNHG